MKLIESKAEYIPQEEGLDGIYKQIELAGRTAYHSQDKITPNSAKDFVDRMIKSKHGAALEHGTVYFKIPTKDFNYEDSLWGDDIDDTFPFYSPWVEHNCRTSADGTIDYVTTNYRFFLETEFMLIKAASKELFLEKYLCPPTEFHEKRYTMRFTCSRAIANELVRHRTMSFLQESTRYINYSKERHGEKITYIKPSWLEESEEEANSFLGLVMAGAELNEHGEKVYPFFESLVFAEKNYFVLLNKGFTPQQARDVLPNATKTELIMTGFASDWKHVMDLRLFEKTGAVHPDMKDLMQKAQKVMQEAGIWDDIISKPSKFE